MLRSMSPTLTTDPYTRGMAAIGGTVSVAAALAPRRMLRLFGLPPEQATGAALLGWRLMAVRTAAISGLAVAGNPTARDLFLPVQFADQATWWWGHARGELPRRTTVMAATASGAIIALDLLRRGAGRRPGPD